MATERFDKRTDAGVDQQYFRHYADLLLPFVKGKVLDLGCGQGWLTKEMAGIPEVDFIDAFDKFDGQPAETQAVNIQYHKCDIKDITEPNQPLDTIVSTEFIEHITQEDFEKLLDKIHKWLKPNGLFLGSTPNKLVSTTNPFHLQEYTADELRALFDKHGFVGEIDFPRRDLSVWVLNKK